MTDRTKDLAYWINEREYMRMKKEGEVPEQDQPPWSVDPNMANVRYCNVHREDDRVTRWIKENWRNHNASDSNLTLAMVAARMINWPETLAEIGYPRGDIRVWGETAKEIIRRKQSNHEKAWTSAYTISTCGRSMKKEAYVFNHVLSQVSMVPWNFGGMSLAGAHAMLTTVDGLGSFLAAQVVADLKNTPGHPLRTAVDWQTWAAPGPGSLRGLTAYFGKPIRIVDFEYWINLAYEEVMPHVFPYVGDIHMQDFQNDLCEFSKYIRVKEGDGRVRNVYRPG